MKVRNKTLLFLVGLFAVTEVNVVGFLAISEIVLYMVAPFVFFKEYRRLRQAGFITFLTLVLLVMCGCVIASLVNHTPFPYFCRGFFSVYAIMACSICLFSLLHQNLDGVRWFLLGYALSLVVNIFIFQKGSARHAQDIALVSAAAMESTLNSVLFWSSRLPHWLFLPVRGWFVNTPWLYSVTSAIVVAIVSLFMSGGSGRSAAICAMVSAVLLFFGRKTVSGLYAFRRRFVLVLLALLALGVVVKVGYKHLALSGALGEAGMKKYLDQTQKGEGLLGVIISGRPEFFAGFYCACRNPIFGYGPWAIDWDRITYDFITKYGSAEDVDSYMRLHYGINAGRLDIIPSHSYIIGFWTWYGCFGLIFWLYMLYIYWKTLSTYFVHIVPWFGCFATMLPLAFWDVMFSPFGNRIYNSLLMVMCLMAKAVHEKKLQYVSMEG